MDRLTLVPRDDDFIVFCSRFLNNLPLTSCFLSLQVAVSNLSSPNRGSDAHGKVSKPTAYRTLATGPFSGSLT